jgi:hypothetical protein
MFPTKRDKDRARTLANHAQARGILVPKNCEDCGKPDTQKHHEDYSKPLDVTWLCTTCHGLRHTTSNGLCSRCQANPVRGIGQRYCKSCHCESVKAARRKERERTLDLELEVERLRSIVSRETHT